MKAAKFKTWLENQKYDEDTVDSRMSNCRNVEKYYSLDKQFSKDEGYSLMEKLSYSTDDEREKAVQKHKVPIDGNIREGSATLKSAVKLYMEFCKEI